MDAFELVGKPWVPGGRGPANFDCWGLVMFWVADKTGQTLPDFPAEATDVLAVTRSFQEERRNKTQWEQLDAPEVNCVVAMGRNKTINHAGVYLGEGLVLHSSRDSGKVAIQRIDQLRRQWSNVHFFKYHDWRCSDSKPI